MLSYAIADQSHDAMFDLANHCYAARFCFMLQTVAMMLSFACADQCNDAMFVVLRTIAMLRRFCADHCNDNQFCFLQTIGHAAQFCFLFWQTIDMMLCFFLQAIAMMLCLICWQTVSCDAHFVCLKIIAMLPSLFCRQSPWCSVCCCRPLPCCSVAFGRPLPWC